MMKEISEELNKWRDVSCSGIGRFNIVKRSVLPNLIHKFNTAAMKTPASYFVDIDKLILKFIWKGKRPRIANTVLKENKVRGLTAQHQDFLPNNSNQDSVVLAREETNRSMKWNREPRSSCP